MYFTRTILFLAATLPSTILSAPTISFTPVSYSSPLTRRCDPDDIISSDGQCLPLAGNYNTGNAYWVGVNPTPGCSNDHGLALALRFYNNVNLVSLSDVPFDSIARAFLREQLHEGDQIQMYSSSPAGGQESERPGYGKNPKCQHFVGVLDRDTPLNTCQEFAGQVECIVLARQEAEGYLGQPY